MNVRRPTTPKKSPPPLAGGVGGGVRAPRSPERPAPLPQGEGGSSPTAVKEIGGPKGPEPTRYGDWEVKGRCIDF
ncbi:MAG TPA: DUF1674 domain-containing protein [Acetobacteraceae bacterium]|nr:DUF1674 domain-containing protein [Acetobacteraceae bacterium]